MIKLKLIKPVILLLLLAGVTATQSGISCGKSPCYCANSDTIIRALEGCPSVMDSYYKSEEFKKSLPAGTICK